MPVADFPGDRGWGYDGVYLWAAHRAYGGPEAFARFVDAAHAAGIAVILDLVYNHVGASGNKAMAAFGPYFTDKYSTFWGEAINYDDEGSDGVREWACQSAEYWVGAMHVDGLRLDAIHAIFDQRPEHLVAELTRRAHARAPGALVIAESGMNDPKVMRDGRARRLGLRRGLGRRLPPRAAHPDHRRARGLLQRVRDAGRPGQGAAPPAPARRHLVDLPRAHASAPRPTTCRARRSSSSTRTTTRSATARSATGCPRRPARSARS